MKKKLLIRIWIIVAIVSIASFSDWSFAAEESEDIKSVAYIINFLTEILAWIWVIFAKFAWEFLTNKRVYWEVLWLDSLLRQYWVVVRNFANFWLWAFFTYIILTAIFKKEDISWKLKNTFLRLLIAWIWIQMSWFFTAVVLDASTITLVAVWSFPSQAISKDPKLEENFETPLLKYLDNEVVINWEELVLFPKDSKASKFLQATTIQIEKDDKVSKKQFLDDLLPKYDDVSWPLYYMWMSILDSFSISRIHVKDTDKSWWKTTILNTIINGWTTIVFSIEMAVLCVIALLRIFYLRMFITLSPFVVLLYCIKKADAEGWWKLIDKYLKSFTDNLNLKSFFLNAFKPTIIVLWISLSVIFVAAIKWVILTWEDLNLQWVTISSSCPNTESNQISCQTHVDSPLFGGVFKNLSKTFMDIIISIITIILVYQIIKFSVGLGKWTDFISKKAEKLQNNIWELITSVPIVPVSGYDEKWLPTTNHMSLGSTFWIWGKPTIMEQRLRNKQQEFRQKASAETDKIIAWLWLWEWGLNESAKTEISWIGAQGSTVVWLEILKKKRDTIKRISNSDNTLEVGEWYKMTLSPDTARDGGFWMQEFTKWLNEVNPNDIRTGDADNSTWINMVNTRQKMPDEEKDIAKLFSWTNGAAYAKAYANLFKLQGVSDWNTLRNEDISKRDKE